jgi:phosphoribosylaminoimidazole-succinocarboxamide synthase
MAENERRFYQRRICNLIENVGDDHGASLCDWKVEFHVVQKGAILSVSK